jgi:IS30 family transposase
VLDRLAWGWSPQQIAGHLRVEYPSEPERWMSAEAIYLMPRGELKNVVSGRVLRTWRVNRRPHRPAGIRARFADLPRLTDRSP